MFSLILAHDLSRHKHFSFQSVSLLITSQYLFPRVWKIEMLVVFTSGRITSVWNGRRVPVKDAFQQTRGFPAAWGGIVPGRVSQGDSGGERKGRKRGAEPRMAELLNDHGESGLGCGSQHIHLDLRQAKDWFPLTVLLCQNTTRSVTRTPPIIMFESINLYLSRWHWLSHDDRQAGWYWSLRLFPLHVGRSSVSKNNCTNSV